jgi:hypothetical protein
MPDEFDKDIEEEEVDLTKPAVDDEDDTEGDEILTSQLKASDLGDEVDEDALVPEEDEDDDAPEGIFDNFDE